MMYLYFKFVNRDNLYNYYSLYKNKYFFQKCANKNLFLYLVNNKIITNLKYIFINDVFIKVYLKMIFSMFIFYFKVNGYNIFNICIASKITFISVVGELF